MTDWKHEYELSRQRLAEEEERWREFLTEDHMRTLLNLYYEEDDAEAAK